MSSKIVSYLYGKMRFYLHLREILYFLFEIVRIVCICVQAINKLL